MTPLSRRLTYIPKASGAMLYQSARSCQAHSCELPGQLPLGSHVVSNLARARKTTRAWQPCCIKAPAVVRPTRASCPDNYRSAAMLYLTWREPARQLGLGSHVVSKRPQAVVRPSRASCTDNYRLAAMLYLIRRTRTGRALNWVAAVLFQRNLRICD